MIRSAPPIVLHNVSKRYGERLAVTDLHLDVASGEVLGFLGPNGAGKTTTIRMLTGFIHPSSGTVRLLGRDMARPMEAIQARCALGYVPDVAGFDASATGAWLLDELAHLQGRPAIDRQQLVEMLGLHPADLRRAMGRLSRGTRQKINIIQGLQHRPDVLVLDEPTEGLDPLTKRALFDLLRAAQQRGATILFSSHILSEVEELCDRVALIRAGRLVAVERIASLRSHMHRRVMLQVRPDAHSGVALRLASLPTICEIVEEQESWRFAVSELPPLMRLLSELPVVDLTIEAPSLEEVFLRHYRVDGKVSSEK